MSSPAGWFPDPSDPSRQRYFDGNQWTSSYAPYTTPNPPAGPPQPANSKEAGSSAIDWWRSRSKLQKQLLGGGATIAVLMLVIGDFSGGDKTGGDQTAASSASSSAPTSSTYTTEAPPTYTSEEYQDSAVSTCEDAIKKSLKDPDSAKFGDDWKAWKITAPNSTPPEGMTYNQAAGDLYYNAGGGVNAKNGFGGYTGSEPYYCDVVITTDGTTHARAHSVADALNPPP